MSKFDKQTLIDLEFPTVLGWLSNYAIGPTAAKRIDELGPSSDFNAIEDDLQRVNELCSIRRNGESFPSLDFEELQKEIQALGVKNSVLTPEGFSRITTASILGNQLADFFKRKDKLYPLLAKVVEDTEQTTEIIELIRSIFDLNWKVVDDASAQLTLIRAEIKQIRNQINKNFDKEIRRLLKGNYLGETHETFYNERRVLTVLASYKRQVSGNVVGSSKTGNLVYIEPQVNVPLNNELELQIDEERKEVYKILRDLTQKISDYLPLIENYQAVLTEFDFINAKARLALELDCVLPGIVLHTEIELVDAYHPILWRNNKLLGKQTIPQRIHLDKKSRMLVISGPNAGGKSITLKTVGLLQLMLQSGLLIPVNPNSHICLFQQILSDIGDNQSIENELSTYSYRLRRMNHFLKVTNKRTLLLLDEFGTGSDPDLGGALAEVFFEELYKKGCFSVITTHYSNIKLKANSLPEATNGCMLFNSQTLEPLYRFNMGQPGSSFTFEVAQINGIPLSIIEEAKSRLDDKKVKMDRLLNELQKEKNHFERMNQDHQEAQQKALQIQLEFQNRKKQLDQKLSTQKEQSEKNQKYITYGTKFDSYVNRYNMNTKNKGANNDLLQEIKKYIAVEKLKRDDVARSEKLKAEAKLKIKKKKIEKPEEDPYQRHKIIVGSTVKLIDTKKSGTVESLDGENATVLFGFMKLKVEKIKLAWLK